MNIINIYSNLYVNVLSTKNGIKKDYESNCTLDIKKKSDIDSLEFK